MPRLACVAVSKMELHRYRVMRPQHSKSKLPTFCQDTGRARLHLVGLRMCGAITFGEYAHTEPRPNAIFLHFRIYCSQYLSFGFNSRPLFMILLFFTAANEIFYTFMCAFCSIVKSCWFTHCIGRKSGENLRQLYAW